MNQLERFQQLQLTLVREGFDTTFRARRDGEEALSWLTVSLHESQEPETMTRLSELITGNGFQFTAEGETVAITAT
jgi:hypothetical protein